MSPEKVEVVELEKEFLSTQPTAMSKEWVNITEKAEWDDSDKSKAKQNV